MLNHSAIKKLFLIIGANAVFAIMGLLIVVIFKQKPKPPAVGAEVVRAVQRFRESHRPLPATVTFTQLISEGYLSTNVLRDFGASEVTVFLNATNTSPGMLQMDALMPDGSHTSLLSDGSAQGLTKHD